MRVMAIDYGDVRTGVAVSDASGLLAGYTTVVHSRSSGRAARRSPGLPGSGRRTSW